LAPDQPWKPWYRYQHIYIWALYGFLTVQWMVFSDFASIVTGRIGSQTMRQRPRRRDVAKLVAGKLVHVGWAVALPLMYHRWWVVLAFYFACSWVVGFVLALFFQLAHCSEESEFTGPGAARRGDDFVAHQMRTTANIDCHVPVLGTGVAWLMGGLHHQIEHHLAPGIPHTAYPQMSREVRRMCTQLHVEYHEHHGLWSALRSHARWLRKMGRDPAHNPVR
ncbi:MAG: fatty acid desaturase, partial [Ilumatobacteraceae bacterium]